MGMQKYYFEPKSFRLQGFLIKGDDSDNVG